MSDEGTEANGSVAGEFAALPRWVRTGIAAVLAAECALAAAGLVHGPTRETGTVMIDLTSARPAPGFSTL
jgi:hypothetical protein